MIKRASIEQLIPSIYSKLKSLGEIGGVVPIANIQPGNVDGEARAYVSSEDRNSDGVPDKIRMVYPKLNIDLQQELSGITSVDITSFPGNLDQEKFVKVLMILGAVVNLLNHEQDHLDGFSVNDESPSFSPESSADFAGSSASKKFVDKYTNIFNNSKVSRDKKMINELKKLSSHLYKKGEHKIANEILEVIDNVSSNDIENADIESEENLEFLTNEEDQQEYKIVVAQEHKDWKDLEARINLLFSRYGKYAKQVEKPIASMGLASKAYGKTNKIEVEGRERELVAQVEATEEKFGMNNPAKHRRFHSQSPLNKKNIVIGRLSRVRNALTVLQSPYKNYIAMQKAISKGSEGLLNNKDRSQSLQTGAAARTSDDALDNIFSQSLFGPISK